MTNKIFSISVTYNPDIELLDRQIASLSNQVDNIVIVDNGSRNLVELSALVKKVQIENQKIEFLQLPKNMGLGYAQNVGLKFAIENGASDTLLMDQDSVIETGFIENLLKDRAYLTDKNIEVGAIGPVYYNEITKQVYPITKFWGPFIERIKPSNKPEEASFLIASGCLISVEMFKIVGLMNEELFIDFIDVDWCFRSKKLGYGVFVSPNATMMHTIGETRLNVGGRSIAIHSPLRRYYLYRNSFFMLRNKNIPVGYKLREITFNTLRLVIYFTISKDRVKYLKYSLKGFKDGMNGVGGECSYKY